MLLIWDSDGNTFYVLPKGHKMCKPAWESNGVYINSDDTENHPIEELNEWLATEEAETFKVDMPYKGEIKYVTCCGFVI